jgi:hypothetical protein
MKELRLCWTLHGTVNQKTPGDIFTAVRTSDLRRRGFIRKGFPARPHRPAGEPPASFTSHKHTSPLRAAGDAGGRKIKAVNQPPQQPKLPPAYNYFHDSVH